MASRQRSNGPPFQCSTPGASEIDVTSMRLTWNVVHEGPSPNCYRLHGQGEDGSIVSETCSDATVKVFGLNPGVGYIFTVSGNNRYGEGPRSYPSNKIKTNTYSRTGHYQVSAARYHDLAARPQMPEFITEPTGLDLQILVAKDAQVKSLNDRLVDAQRSLNEEKTLTARLRQEMANNKQKRDKNQNLIHSLEEAKHELELDDVYDEEQKVVLQVQIAQLTESKHKLQLVNDKLEKAVTVEKGKIDKVKKAGEKVAEDLQSKIESLTSQLNHDALSRKQLKDEHEATTEAMNELHNQVKGEKAAKETLTEALQECTDNTAALKKKLKDATHHFDEEQVAHQVTKQELHALKAQLAQSKDAKSESEIELRDVRSKIHTLEAELEHMHGQTGLLNKLQKEVRDQAAEIVELNSIIDAHDEAPKAKAPKAPKMPSIECEIEVEVKVPKVKMGKMGKSAMMGKSKMGKSAKAPKAPKAPKMPSIECEVEIEVEVEVKAPKVNPKNPKSAVPSLNDEELTLAFFEKVYDDADEDGTEFLARMDMQKALAKLVPRNGKIAPLEKIVTDFDGIILDRDAFVETVEEWIENGMH